MLQQEITAATWKLFYATRSFLNTSLTCTSSRVTHTYNFYLHVPRNNWAILSNLKYIFETAHPTSRERPEGSDIFGYSRCESAVTQVNKDERCVSKKQLFTYA
jgi:hypothetical protein